MSTQDDVRRIALSLPLVEEEQGRFSFLVGGAAKPKAFAWVWLERIHPRKARVPQPAVLAIRVSGEDDKHALIAMAPDIFFTEAHYDGYPAILVRLDAIGEPELERLLVDAWRRAAPRKVLAEFEHALPPETTTDDR